jgi:hypothetical protein
MDRRALIPISAIDLNRIVHVSSSPLVSRDHRDPFPMKPNRVGYLETEFQPHGEELRFCPSSMTRGSHKRSTIWLRGQECERDKASDVAGSALAQRNTSRRARAS